MWFGHCVSTVNMPKIDTHPSVLADTSGIQADAVLNAHRPKVALNDFLEVICAMHFASLVAGPIEDRSGLMLIAPSGSLKSTLLMIIPTLYPDTCVCDSNWYYGKLLKMRGTFYNGGKRSIVIPELASVYAGDPRTGGRMEQMFQQLAGEGSITTQEADSRWERYEMRAQIFSAMTPEFARKKHPFWEEGFHRRFLWAHLAMENDEILMDYLTAWKRAEIDISQPIIEPAQKRIPVMLNYGEKIKIRKILESQKDFGPNHTRFVFLCRTLSVLRWHYKRIDSKKNPFDTLKRFSVCLSPHAALLVLPDEPIAHKFRQAEEKRELKASKNHKPKKKQKRPEPMIVPVAEGATV
jgi:hypothetical protein